MDRIGKNRILRNLDYLIEHTGSVETVCVHLITKDQLTIREFQIVKSQPSDEQKCTELYTKLLNKPNNSFEDLLEVLEDTGNEHVAKKLKIPCAQEVIQAEAMEEQFNTQQKVEIIHIPWIADILSAVDYTQWPIFMRSLVNHDMVIINDLQKFAISNPHSELVYKTLNYWISVNGSTANWEKLIKALRDCRLHHAAESLTEAVLKRYPSTSP